MRPTRFFAGLFLLTNCTLMMEIIQTRLLSVISWYHLAFLVISAAMFGMTAGAVWVFLRKDCYTRATLSNDLARASAHMAISTVICVIGQMTLNPILVRSVSGSSVFLFLILLISLPFFFAGLAVSLALTRSPFSIGVVYAVDMLGAATGCLGVLGLLQIMDAPSAILLCAAGCAVASVLFRDRDLPQPAGINKLSRIAVKGAPWIAALLVVASILNGQTSRGLQPLYVKGALELPDAYPYRKWNSFSRIAATKPMPVNIPGELRKRDLGLWGPSPALNSMTLPRIDLARLNIDGEAGTKMYRFTGDPNEIALLSYDVTNLSYYIRHNGRSAVIGVGSGRDVLSAWLFGFPDVTGIEINPIFIDLLTKDPFYSDFCRLATLKGIRLIVDEGRSWFVRSSEKFDLIQMSLIDTWAATGAGAFTLSENGLYTIEAWTAFLNRLNDRGVFTVSRWFGEGEANETGRTVSLAAASLLQRGVTRVRDHMFVATCGPIATLLISPTPLSVEDIQTLRQKCNELSYQVLLAPDQEAETPVLRGIVNAADLPELYRFTSDLDLNLKPTTDETPFFFNLLPLGNPFKMYRIYKETLEKPASGVVSGNLEASLSLLAILGVSITLVIATILVPLISSTRGINRRLIAGGTVYFGLLGFGFMFVEIGLLQRLSVFLGHPIYSLSVVLFSVIIATGAGSYASEKLPLSSPGRLIAWSLLLGAYLLSLPFWLGALIGTCDHYSVMIKALVSVAIIAPAGMMMGFGFPTGIRLTEAVDAAPTPWFWGINGATGVLASVIAVAASIAFGIRITLIIGGLAYLALIPFAMLIGFGRVAEPRRR
jgi:hypothetical protein